MGWNILLVCWLMHWRLAGFGFLLFICFRDLKDIVCGGWFSLGVHFWEVFFYLFFKNLSDSRTQKSSWCEVIIKRPADMSAVHFKYLHQWQQQSLQNILISKAKLQPTSNVDVYMVCSSAFLQSTRLPVTTTSYQCWPQMYIQLLVFKVCLHLKKVLDPLFGAWRLTDTSTPELRFRNSPATSELQTCRQVLAETKISF